MARRSIEVNVLLLELDARLPDVVEQLLKGIVVLVERPKSLMEVLCFLALGHLSVYASEIA